MPSSLWDLPVRSFLGKAPIGGQEVREELAAVLHLVFFSNDG